MVEEFFGIHIFPKTGYVAQAIGWIHFNVDRFFGQILPRVKKKSATNNSDYNYFLLDLNNNNLT